MRIAYLIRESLEQTVSPAYLELIEALNARGHEITVLNETGSFGEFDCKKVFPKRFPDWPSGILNRLAYSKAVKPLLKELKPDLVLASFAEALYHLGGLAAPKVAVVNDEWAERRRFTPLFGSFKRVGFLPFPTQTKFGLLVDEYWQLASFKRTDGIVFVNLEFEAKIRQRIFGPLTVAIPNAVDSGGLKPDAKRVKELKELFPKPIVLFLARLELQKNPLFFIEVAEKVLERNDAFFLVAGDGFLKGKCRKAIERKGLQGSVKLLGWVEGKEKASLFKASDVYILPSLFEPFGISSLEAISLECAAVCSRVGGLKELVSQGFALGFENQNLDQAVSGINSLLESPSMMKEYKNKASLARKTFSWKKTAKEYEKFFEKVVEFKGGKK